MTKVFLDSNVIFDFFVERKPFDKEAEEIMELAYHKSIELFCSAVSYTTLFHQLSELSGKQKAFLAMKDLRNLISTVSVDGQVIDKVLETGHLDMEDSIQLVCATTITDIFAFVTRNPKYFKNKYLVIQTPKEFLEAFILSIHE